MRTKKTWVILVCTIILIGILVGCKGANDQNDDNNSQNANQGHKHTIVAISDEVYFATLEYSNDLVSKVSFYQFSTISFLNDQIIEFNYDEGKKIKEATVFGVFEGKKQPLSDGFDVKYKESGELEYLCFTAQGEQYLCFTATTNEDGKVGYEISNGSEDKSIVLLGKNGLTEDITSENCNITIKYDENNRISECKGKPNEINNMPDSMIFDYKGNSCCFSEILLKSEEMEITATVDRNEKHQATLVGWKYDELGFLMEYTYKYTSDDIQLILSSKQIVDGRNQSFTYTYDDNDRLIESLESMERELIGGNIGKYLNIKRYNAEGVMIYQSSVEESISDEVLRYWDKYETFFDGNGIRTSGTDESKRYDSEGNFEKHSKTIYTFDKEGNIIEEVEENYDKDGNIIS